MLMLYVVMRNLFANSPLLVPVLVSWVEITLSHETNAVHGQFHVGSGSCTGAGRQLNHLMVQSNTDPTDQRMVTKSPKSAKDTHTSQGKYMVFKKREENV